MTPLEQALAGPLAALTAYPQFVLYALEPMANGKTRKFPIDPATGRPADGQDPRNWMTAEQALADGRPVGFVFTEADPFFFLDIDNALQADNTWSPLAQSLCARLAGCAVEVSQSGRGLHVFGRTAPVEHGKRNHAEGLELYTSRRFVALTGTGADGDAGHDATGALAALVGEYFPPGADAPGAYGEGPRPEWRGPTDDDDLIRRALRSQSTAAIFGGKASFADLWHAESDALARAYPRKGEGELEWDGSAADAALAAHLAFWTGCDGPRIERLMRRSALVRDKWDRGDYLPRTIAASCPPGKTVCQDAEPVPAGAPGTCVLGPSDPAPPMPDFSDGYAPRAGCGVEDLAAFFHGVTYVASRHEVLMPNGEFLGPEAFNAKLGGLVFRLDDTKTTRKPFECLIGARGLTARKADREAFDPRLPFGALRERHGVLEVNTYRPEGGPRVRGDVTPFLTRYEKIVPDARDRRILFSWVAASVQSPGVKFQWALVLQSGAEALGKSLLGQVLRNALGNPYFHPLTQKERRTDAFSGWKYRKLAVLVDEITRSETRGDNEGMWKDLITSDFQGVEAKGVDARMEEVFYNLIFTTNEKGVFRLSDASRRFAVFHYAIQNDEEKRAAGLDDDGFTEWMKSGGMERVVAWFADYPVDPEFDPRVVITAPRTSSWEDAVAESRDALCSVLEEAIEANNRPGLMRGWASVKAAADALHERRYKATPQAVARLLEQLGYEPHPGLRKNGRTARRTLTDNAEVRLFIRRGHPHSYMQGAVAEQQYDEDQKL